MNNISIFNDTLTLCRSNEVLKAAIADTISGTRLYPAEEYPELGEGGCECTVTVTPQRTFEAAFDLAQMYPGCRTGVLNFANSVNPGGGVKLGANAQEECLCRCSTLYPCLVTPELKRGYYNRNRLRMNPLASDDCIHTPGVVVFKSDGKSPELLPEEQWIRTDVITCAAPNLSLLKLPRSKQYDLHVRRGRHILTVAAANGIEALVLGAFGCGAFMNHAETVARAYKDILPEFTGHFREIRFAVVSDPEKPSKNYRAFQKLL